MILSHNSNTELYDKPFNIDCPHCGNSTNLTLISPPNYSQLARYKPKTVGIAYQCSSCIEPVFLKFKIERYDLGNYRIQISENAMEIEKPTIEFEFEYIPENVVSDFKEALECYSITAYNAFAAMTRRTIQSAADQIGAKGKSKVQNQIKEMKEMAEIDDETYEILSQIIIDGHDGAHPHLPSLSAERAEILLELLKDVMYQLFVRKGKLKKASELRKKQIDLNK
tara:strand:+ start:61 stop:735 length:675 start_codon:yes stop_codon:yes gene_type:complete